MSLTQTQSAAPVRSGITPDLIMQQAFGFGPPLILDSALHFGVFEQLERGPKTVEQVSADAGASERGMRALMNALVGMSLLRRDFVGNYSLTQESRVFLLSSSPSFHGGLIRRMCNQMIPRWMQLKDVIRAGAPLSALNAEQDGNPFFLQFVADLFPVNHRAARLLATAVVPEGLSTPFRVLDLASGSGVWGIGFAQESTHVHVTAVDRAPVNALGASMAAQCGVGAQYSLLDGDLSDVNFGTGYQAAILGHILHSVGETESRTLLRKTFAALAPGGTLAVAEWLVNEERSGPMRSLLFAVNMLINTEAGDVFSLGEISGWLQDAGFEDIRLFEAPAPSPLILATRPARG